MIVGVPRETLADETRVALTPAVLPMLAKAGLSVALEAGAGDRAGFPDAAWEAAGARVVAGRDELFREADIIAQVLALGANPEAGRADLARMRPGQLIVGMHDPLGRPEAARELAARGVTALALELMPRITRAQPMDVLSSMATVAGYKAVLLAAAALPRMFPMLTTAAGTIKPARVFVIGAGVAGLQAIATARRLGAVVRGYDVRPAAREQVESLGAVFVELPLTTADAEGQGGYARAMDEDFYRRQRELMAKEVTASDVVVTTAAIPGKPAPRLITREMVEQMAPGSVIVDLAAPGGGNCELTRPGEEIAHQGVRIIGPLNLPATVPHDASMMYGRNVATCLAHLVRQGELKLDDDDPIVRETIIARDGRVVHPRVLEALGEAPPAQPATQSPAAPKED